MVHIGRYTGGGGGEQAPRTRRLRKLEWLSWRLSVPLHRLIWRLSVFHSLILRLSWTSMCLNGRIFKVREALCA